MTSQTVLLRADASASSDAAPRAVPVWAKSVPPPQRAEIDAFLARHAPVLDKLRASAADLKAWTELQKQRPYAEFLFDLQGRILYDPNGEKPETRALVLAVAEAAGLLNANQLLELAERSTSEVRDGKWAPQIARIRQNAAGGKKSVKREDLDALGRFLYDWSFATTGSLMRGLYGWFGKEFQGKGALWDLPLVPKVIEVDLNGNIPLPGGREIPIQVAGKNPIGWAAYAVSHGVVPVVDTVGEVAAAIQRGAAYPFGRIAGLPQDTRVSSDNGLMKLLNMPLDALRKLLTTGLREQYLEMHEALKPMNLSTFATAHKDSKLRDYSDDELRMFLYTGKCMSDASYDITKMIDVLRNPKIKNKPGAIGALQSALRYTVQSLGDLLHFSATTTRNLTDADNWRLFTLNAVAGGGIQFWRGTYPVTVGAGIGMFTPSLSEFEQTGRMPMRFDFSWGSFGSPHFAAFPDSRGGKYSVKPPFLPFLSGSAGAYNAKIGVGVPYVAGAKLAIDKVYGPGGELQWFPSFGARFLGTVVAGGNLMVFHRGVGFIAPIVQTGGEWLASSIDATSDLATEGLWKAGLKGPLSRAQHAIRRAIGQDPVAPAANVREKLKEDRIGRSGSICKQIGTSLGYVRAYRERLVALRAEGKFLVEKTDPLYTKLTRGFSEPEALDIIERYLEKTEARYIWSLARMRELVEQPPQGWRSELRSRREIRALARQMADDQMTFEFTSQLLFRVFATTDPVQGS